MYVVWLFRKGDKMNVWERHDAYATFEKAMAMMGGMVKDEAEDDVVGGAVLPPDMSPAAIDLDA